MRNFIWTILPLLLLTPGGAGAQERSLVRKGNELYQQKKYAEAAAAYQQALQKQPQFVPGAFNLGNALIQQKQYDAARKAMEHSARTSRNPVVQSSAQYNTGNTFMSEQQWQQAVEAYKQALRKNPRDSDAQYNLSYALARLKQQQQQNQQQDKQQQDKKDQQKQDQPKDKKDQQPNDGNEEQQKRRQPQPSKLSEQQADNLLKALQQDERKVHDKLQQGKAMPVKVEKDW